MDKKRFIFEFTPLNPPYPPANPSLTSSTLRRNDTTEESKTPGSEMDEA
jgi:hypothetical protein